jgi:transcription elongation factor GreA
MASEKILVTKEGLEELQRELKKLKEVDRVQIVEEVKEARLQGDLSENADYDAAKNRQAQIEKRIFDIENTINNAQIIEDLNAGLKGKKTVVVGATVTFKETGARGVEETFKIVGSTETNPSEGKISNESPLALAMLDHREGDEVTVNVKKPYKVKILKITI